MLKIVYGKDANKHADLMRKVYRFRHKIFVQERGWNDLANTNEEEKDQFDNDDTIHQILMSGECVIGYQRFIPTTRPHLLATVLSDLCIEPAPKGPAIYEWTRFCLEQTSRETFPRKNSAFLYLAQGAVEWGLANDIRTMTVVIDCRLMVIGMQLRFRVRPLGFPKRIGREEVVALEFGFNEETLEHIHEAQGMSKAIIPIDDLFIPERAEA